MRARCARSTHLPAIRAPLLLIAGGADPRTTPADAERLFAAAPEPKQLWVVPEPGTSTSTASRRESTKRAWLHSSSGAHASGRELREEKGMSERLGLDVLVIDDEKNIRATLGMCIEGMGCRVTAVATAEAACAAIASRTFDLAFLDLRLGDANGLDLLPRFFAARLGHGGGGR